MMQHEFERLAGRTVTAEQYEAIEKLYNDSDLSKQDFVKGIRPILKSIPEEKHNPIIQIGVRDRSGFYLTPNGCWHHTILAELVDVSIKTGKMQVRKIPNSYDERYMDGTYVEDYRVEFVG